MLNKELLEEVISDIQAQYRDTNIEELIKGIINIQIKYIFNAYKSLVNDNLSLKTAKEGGLDLWGQLLHISRYLPSDDTTAKGYTYFNFNRKNFNSGLLFYNKNNPDYIALADEYYRQVLLIMLQNMNVFPSIPQVNVFALDAFSNYGQVYVKDSTDMSYQVYVFNTQLPDWLKFMFSNYDILPRPAGVGVKVEERILRRFGFGADKPYKPQEYKFWNFNDKNFNAIYYDENNNYGDNYRSNESFGKDITQEVYNRRQNILKNIVSGFYNSTFYAIDKEIIMPENDKKD